MKIAVIGAGSWGTAIASMLAQKHVNVVLWARQEELVGDLISTRENTRYLPGISLPKNLVFTSDIEQAVQHSNVIIIVTPSHAVRETIKKIANKVSKDTFLVTAAKGLELGTLKRMSQVIEEEIPGSRNRIVVLSGPNHAEEVGQQCPTTAVAASASQKAAEAIQDIFMLPYFRVYTNPDTVGVELGGALKNIIALGAGIVDGLGFGDNTKAALMTRGLAEIARLGIAMNANPLTFAGLSGVGDLIVTCTSRHSRNRRAGMLLAQGKSVADIEKETSMVVEGIRSTIAAYELSQKYGVSMPITEQTYQILYKSKSPAEALMSLMTRGKTHEAEEVALDPGNWEYS